MEVRDNPVLTTGLLPTGVTSLSGRLRYSDNPELVAISEMPNLTSLGNYLTLIDIQSSDLPDFPALTTIGGNLTISENPNITQLPGFPQNLTIGGELRIQNNPNLSDCAIDPICTFLQDVGIATISNNTGCCTDATVLGEACDGDCTECNDLGAILYVNANLAPGGNGSSWANAFNNLQDALDAAETCDIDEIWVAEGVYYPSKNKEGAEVTNRGATFFIDRNIRIYGGFPAMGNPFMLDRDPQINKTVLSGDVDQNDENPDGDFINTPVDQMMGNNAYHVLCIEDVNQGTVLDGFYITAGNAFENAAPNDPLLNSGGGIFLTAKNQNADPKINHCYFSGNYAWLGGGAMDISAENGRIVSPGICNTEFLSNLCDYRGGAIYNRAVGNGIASTEISDCLFNGNEAQQGGAIANNRNCMMEGSGCIFRNNKADDSIEPASGGAVFNYGRLGSNSASFKKCFFQGNEAKTHGGAVYNDGFDSGSSCTPTFENSLFSGNKSLSGAVYNVGANSVNSNGYCAPSFFFCTFAANQGTINAAVMTNHGASPVLEASILWGNGSSTDQIQDLESGYDAYVVNCIIENTYSPGTNVLDENPFFLDLPDFNNYPTTAGDFHLSSCSPAIDQGSANGSITEDLEMALRPQGNASDWGCYESSGVACSENCLDFDGSNDYAIITSPLTGTVDFTAELWVRREEVTSSGYNRIWVWGAPGTRFELGEDGGQLRVLEWDGSFKSYFGPNIMVGQWYHIALTRSSGNMKVYVNGALEHSFSSVSELNTAILVGEWPGGGGENWKGPMEEFRIWNYARSQAQIMDAMNCKLSGNEAGLVAYYDFNQGTPGGDNTGLTTIIDRTGNGNDGTLYEFALTGSTSNWVSCDAPLDGDCAVGGCGGEVVGLPLQLKTKSTVPTCPNANDGTATVLAWGGAQSKGNGRFNTTTEFLGFQQLADWGVFPTSGDLNSDGSPDLFLFGTPTALDVWFNNGDGTFKNSFQFDQLGFFSNGYGGDLGDVDIFSSARLYFNDNGQVTPYSYQWDANANNQTTATATNLGPGTYFVTVTDSEGNTGLASVEVEGVPVFSTSSASTPVSCDAGDNGTGQVFVQNQSEVVYEQLSEAYPVYIVSEVKTGDLDNDGALDFVVSGSNQGIGEVRVYMGNGDATFVENVGAYIGTSTTGIALGDLNEEGVLDLVEGGVGAPMMNIKFGNGDGTFTLSESFSFSGGGTCFLYGVSLGDLNGDNHLDIIFVSSTACQTIRILLNNGDGTFIDHYELKYAHPFRDALIDDFDGDGDQDFFAVGIFQQHTLFLNDGSANFTRIDESYGLNNFWLGGDAEDLNGDGFPDVFLVGRKGTPNTVLINDGDGTFTPLEGDFGCEDGWNVILIDLDEDGDKDAFVIGLPSKVYFNNGNGYFSEGQYEGNNFFVGDFGDFDQDGDVDFIACNNNSGCRVLRNDFGNPFSYQWPPSANSQTTQTATDLSAGTYTVTVTDGNGCSATTDVVVEEADDKPYLPLTAYTKSTSETCFEAANGSVTVVASGGAQSKGTGRFIPSNEGMENFPPNSSAVLLGDLDNDGDLDAYIANNLEDDPDDVWLNDGDGTFTFVPIDYEETANRSTYGDLGDLDGDNDLDVFLCNAYGESIVLFNNGDGTFFTDGNTYKPADAGQASTNYGIDLGDLDNDGDLDAFVTGWSNRPNKVWKNNGDGTFQEISEGYGNSTSRMVVLADFNGDNYLDAFVGNWDNQDNKVFINNADGSCTFTESNTTYPSGKTSQVKAGDLDGDGDVDVIVRNSFTGNDQILLNDGSGIFTIESFSNGVIGNGMALGDVDGDCDLDVVIPATSGTAIYLNDGDGSFSPGSWGFGSFGSANDINLGDLDNDGDLDIIKVPNLIKVFFNDNSQIEPYTYQWDANAGSKTTAGVGNLAPGTYYVTVTDSDGNSVVSSAEVEESSDFSIQSEVTSESCPGAEDGTASIFGTNSIQVNILDSGQSIFTGGSCRNAELGDLDGDGDLDAYIVRRGANDRIIINDGQGNFTLDPNEYIGNFANGVEFAELDNNPGLDIYVSVDGANKVLVNDGAGNFSILPQDYLTGGTRSSALGDFDQNGTIDVFEGNLRVYKRAWLNDGNAVFTITSELYQATSTLDVETADLNGDGLQDIFSAGSGNAHHIFFGNGDGTFTLSSNSYGENANSWDVELGDLDGDGDIDAFIANDNETPNEVYLNNGQGLFTLAGQYGDAANPAVALGDLDGDGDLDAYVASVSGVTNPDRIWLNNGDGTFFDSGITFSNGRTFDVKMGDLNGDGRLDLLVVHETLGPLIYFNTPNGFSYQWNANANNQTTQTAVDLAAGLYEVTITDANGCSVVEQVLIPEGEQTSTPVVLCPDDSTCVFLDANCEAFLPDLSNEINFIDASGPGSWGAFSAGADFSMTALNNCTLYGFGRNDSDQLGLGAPTSSEPEAQEVPFGGKWKRLASGQTQSIGILEDGTLWTWGGPNATPIQIGTDTDWKEIAAGAEHFLAIKLDGTLWAWGNGTFGKLGQGNEDDQATPVQVGSDTDWRSVAAGTPLDLGCHFIEMFHFDDIGNYTSCFIKVCVKDSSDISILCPGIITLIADYSCRAFLDTLPMVNPGCSDTASYTLSCFRDDGLGM